jgi:serine/threonine protein kinase
MFRLMTGGLSEVSRLIATIHEETTLTMVMEYIPTDLKRHMDLLKEEGERLSQYTVKCYLFQLCNGLYHLSKQGVMHRCDPAAAHFVRVHR